MGVAEHSAKRSDLHINSHLGDVSAIFLAYAQLSRLGFRKLVKKDRHKFLFLLWPGLPTWYADSRRNATKETPALAYCQADTGLAVGSILPIFPSSILAL